MSQTTLQKSVQSSTPIMDTQRLNQTSSNTFQQPPTQAQVVHGTTSAPRINCPTTHLYLKDLSFVATHSTVPQDLNDTPEVRKLKFNHDTATFTVGWDCISRFEKRGNDFFYVKTSLLSDKSYESIVSVEEDPQRLVRTVDTNCVQTCTVVILFNAARNKMIFAHLDTTPMDKFTEWLETYGADMRGGSLFISHIDGTVYDSHSVLNEAQDASRIKQALDPVAFTELHRGLEFITRSIPITSKEESESQHAVIGKLSHPNISVSLSDGTVRGKCIAQAAEGKFAEFDMPERSIFAAHT